MQRTGEVSSESVSMVASPTKPEPILSHLRERKPHIYEVSGKGSSQSYFLQKAHVPNDFGVKLLIDRFFAVEEKEGINKKWKVANQRNIKCSIVFDDSGRYPEVVRKVDIGHEPSYDHPIGDSLFLTVYDYSLPPTMITAITLS